MIQQLSRGQRKEPRGCEAHGDEAEREEERKTSIQPWIREIGAVGTGGGQRRSRRHCRCKDGFRWRISFEVNTEFSFQTDSPATWTSLLLHSSVFCTSALVCRIETDLPNDLTVYF